MKKTLNTFALGILAGLSISLGGFVFCIFKKIGLPIVGGFLFSIGLILVCTLKFNLFTGKIGYVFDKDKKYILDLIVMYLGNLVGALIFGYILYFVDKSFLTSTIQAIATKKIISEKKTFYDLILSGIFCGALVYIAVDVFKNKKLSIFLRLFVLVWCIGTFVVSGFDHCIANMFYFAFSNSYITDLGNVILSLLFVTLGNSLGAIIVNSIKKLASS